MLAFLQGYYGYIFFLNKNKYTTLSFVFIGATGHPLKAIFTSIYPYTFYFREQNATEILPLFMQSYWAPNQVIPSVIGAGVLLYSAFWKKNIIDSLFPITLMFTWAIFPAIALGVVFVVLFMNQLLNGKSFEWGKISLFFLLWVPSAVYLLSSDGAPINNFIWIDRNFEGFITQYSADTLIDIVIFYLFIRHTKNNEKIIDLWFVNIILLITLLWSLYRIGLANDGFVRGQIPLITIIVVYVLRQIPQLLSVKKSIIATLLLAFLLLGASVSMRQIIQTFKESKISNILHNRTVYQPIPYDKYTNTYQMLFQHYSSSEANQYLGKKHSFYENYLSPQHK